MTGGGEQAPPASAAAAAEALLPMMTSYWVSQAIYVAAELGVADHLTEGPATAGELATASGADPGALYRLLRALSSVGVFRQGADDRFGLTPMAELLRSGTPQSMRSLARLYGADLYRAWGDLAHSVRSGQPAFEHVFGVGPFGWFEEHPEAGQIFNEAMTGYTYRAAQAAASAYDFTPFETVVDVGGSLGTLLAAVVAQNDTMRGVLFDLPHVASEAEQRLASLGLAERVACVGGDFFQEVPIDGDAYLLSQILHDWSDDECLAILRSCRNAMNAEGRLLVLELVLPDGDEPHFGKWLDLHMMVCVTGRERTRAEFASLLGAAGFELTRVVPTSADLCLLEARPGGRRPGTT